MASWVYADDPEICELQEKLDALTSEQRQKEGAQKVDEKKTVWQLWVQCDGKLHFNETLAVTGNCKKMGNWQVDDVLIMNAVGEHKYTVNVSVPRGYDLRYRYVICTWNALTENLSIRKWETHLRPRQIHERDKAVERFGWQKDDYKVSKAWVGQKESLVLFHVFNAPFVWPDPKQQMLLLLKLTPMCATNIAELHTADVKEFTASHATQINVKVLELSKPNSDEVEQPEHGTLCGPSDLVMFKLCIKDAALTLYRFDVYTYGKSEQTGDAVPCFYGYGYVEPDELTRGSGSIKLSIKEPTSGKTRCCVKLQYQVVEPLANGNFTFEKTYQNYWNVQHKGLLVGHRGSGCTYMVGENLVRENTIFSFNRAAEQGAAMVELDVMISKDGVPFVFHDQVLKLPLKPEPFSKVQKQHDVFSFRSNQFDIEELVRRAGRIENTTISFPFDAFTGNELVSCHAYRFCAPAQGKTVSCKKVLFEQLPFMLLDEVFQFVKPQVGFLIEVKYPQKDANNQWENAGFRSKFNHNYYVDRILEVVLRKAGSRRIVFSSFDCGICTSLRYKQNLYPVMMILSDPSQPVQYRDERVNDFRRAAYTAKAMNLLGLVVHTRTILRQPEVLCCLQKLGLFSFCWGIENNEELQRERLKVWGVNGIIFDYIGLHEAFTCIGPPIFRLETCRNEKDYALLLRTELRKRCGAK